MNRSYRTILLGGEPRLFGFSLILVAPFVICMAVGLLLGHSLPWMIAGAIFSGALYMLIGDEGFRAVMALIYRYCPIEITQVLFRHWPNSAHRFYRK